MRAGSRRRTITFFRNEYKTPDYTTDRSRYYVQLGTSLTSDIQGYAPDCLTLMADVEDVQAGRLSYQEWEGNAYAPEITPAGVRTVNLHLDLRPVTYTLDEAHAVMLRYWNFLAVEADDKTRYRLAWEDEYGRDHPCRDHLATGDR